MRLWHAVWPCVLCASASPSCADFHLDAYGIREHLLYASPTTNRSIPHRESASNAAHFPTAFKCAQSARCYPSNVRVRGLRVRVDRGVNEFAIDSLFPSDIFVVTLRGPELSSAVIVAHMNNSYTARYCLDTPGFYKMHIVVQSINNEVGFSRPLFGSPYAILVRGPRVPISLPTGPACATGRDATFGRWLRQDVIADSRAWEGALEATRDDHLWVPHNCSITPLSSAEVAALWRRGKVCVLGESYLRTLLAGYLYGAGVFDRAELDRVEYTHESWEARDLSLSFDFHGGRIVPAQLARFVNCSGGATLALASWLEPADTRVAAAMRAAAERARTSLFVTGSPWSGDLLETKRSNLWLGAAYRMTVRCLVASGIDVFDAFELAWPRLDEACDGSHYMCMSEFTHNSVGYWEGLVLSNLLHVHARNDHDREEGAAAAVPVSHAFCAGADALQTRDHVHSPEAQLDKPHPPPVKVAWP